MRLRNKKIEMYRCIFGLIVITFVVISCLINSMYSKLPAMGFGYLLIFMRLYSLRKY